MNPAAFARLEKYALGAHMHGDAARNEPAAIEEVQIYVGLNDAETKSQKLETSHYAAILKQICITYKVPFSFDIVEGGYIHDDGEYTEETSIVLTLIDVPEETVDAVARELCALFHQESVLVTTDHVRVKSIRETL